MLVQGIHCETLWHFRTRLKRDISVLLWLMESLRKGIHPVMYMSLPSAAVVKCVDSSGTHFSFLVFLLSWVI